MDELSPALGKLRRKASFWVAIAAISFVVATAGNFVPDNWTTIPAIALVIWLPSTFIAWRSHRKFGLESRRLEALRLAKAPTLAAQPELPVSEPANMPATTEPAVMPGGGQLADTDPPAVLYLRSFDKDATAAKLGGAFTEEESLTQLLSSFGPVVAIGRPGESLPEAGARRMYVNDSEWQTTVEGLMQRSRLVAIRTGRSGGLRWELRKCFELLSPERLLLVVDNKNELNEMLKQSGRPQTNTVRFRYIGWRSIGSIRAFVIFREDWTPILLRVRGTRFWSTQQVGPAFYGTYIQPRLARTLRPLFKQLGVHWPRPEIGFLNVLISLFIISAFAFSICEIVFGDSEVQPYLRRLGGISGGDPALAMVVGLFLLSLIVFLGIKFGRKYLAGRPGN